MTFFYHLDILNIPLQMKPGYVKNPATNRWVKADGKIGKALLTEECIPFDFCSVPGDVKPLIFAKLDPKTLFSASIASKELSLLSAGVYPLKDYPAFYKLLTAMSREMKLRGSFSGLDFYIDRAIESCDGETMREILDIKMQSHNDETIEALLCALAHTVNVIMWIGDTTIWLKNVSKTFMLSVWKTDHEMQRIYLNYPYDVLVEFDQALSSAKLDESKFHVQVSESFKVVGSKIESPNANVKSFVQDLLFDYKVGRESLKQAAESAYNRVKAIEELAMPVGKIVSTKSGTWKIVEEACAEIESTYRGMSCV